MPSCDIELLARALDPLTLSEHRMDLLNEVRDFDLDECIDCFCLDRYMNAVDVIPKDGSACTRLFGETRSRSDTEQECQLLGGLPDHRCDFGATAEGGGLDLVFLRAVDAVEQAASARLGGVSPLHEEIARADQVMKERAHGMRLLVGRERSEQVHFGLAGIKGNGVSSAPNDLHSQLRPAGETVLVGNGVLHLNQGNV